MPTYCIPNMSSVPGFSEFPWWVGAVDPNNLRYSPENPNWLGAFSMSEGVGANRHVVFRAVQGTVSGQAYVFLSWVIRVASLDTAIDRVNIVLGSGGNYVAFRARIATASSTNAGTQDNNIFSYRAQNCSVAGGVISAVPPDLPGAIAFIEDTGRMWVDVTSPQRLLHTMWAFQIAVPLGVALAPSGVTLPAGGAFKLGYEVWTSLPGMTVTYQSRPSDAAQPTAPLTTSSLQLVAPGLLETQLMDLSTAAAGCTAGVSMDWGKVGVRNVAGSDPARGLTEIRLDLGQPYPPNRAAPPTNSPYNVNHTPNVSSSQFQNSFFAQPTLPAGLSAAQRASLRARFSLANWGSQIGTPTASVWRPTPGGEDVAFNAATSEMQFVWPLPGPGGAADAFTTNLVRGINRWLNATGTGGTPPGNSNHPHQCMLVELSSTDPSVFITRSSVFQNMNVAQASTFSRLAEISVKGLAPISPAPRDVYLYLQTFNLPKKVDREDWVRRQRLGGEMLGGGRLSVSAQRMWQEVEDLAAFFPTYIVHGFHDTGQKMELEDGRTVPILRPQSAFGYFMQHEGDLVGWESRIYGAQKIAENFYHVGVPNNGSVWVETAVQGRSSESEEPLPETKGDGCLQAIILWLQGQGTVGRILAGIIKLFARS